MMAAVETVDFEVVIDKKGNNVSALIKMFESNHDDLAPKRRQKTVIVSDGGRYSPSDVTRGTWMPIQPCGDGSRAKMKVENTRKKRTPRPGFVKELINRFGRLN
ncbi:unnamed protein product [Macrosiphum euphorbiae]|uniref:Uncharacterized protein n=1 Tax=Macrosiphum euphorbiae TaxID=13131 RepID=A0AAV0XHD7_9HEMI|nr:unnamed protein product [Macrosiphum euphorbiae]